eukprot:scaffold1291_cov412-Prasinococcus_capsulatus_cf.AAC.18
MGLVAPADLPAWRRHHCRKRPMTFRRPRLLRLPAAIFIRGFPCRIQLPIVFARCRGAARPCAWAARDQRGWVYLHSPVARLHPPRHS